MAVKYNGWCVDGAVIWCVSVNNLWQAERPVPLLEEADDEEGPNCYKFLSKSNGFRTFCLVLLHLCNSCPHREEDET